jgi:cytidylate kinase
MSINNYNFKNITISGLPGCGSTTLLNKLREELRFDGWKGFSGGEFMRAYAEEKGLFDPTNGGHHYAADYEEDFDRKVDFGIREKLESQKKWIIEAWLSGFFAQGVEGTLKVLMVCSEDSVRIDRLINRDNVSVEKAKENIWDRYDSNLKKWQKIYDKEWQDWVVAKNKVKSGDPIDFWREDLYDVVVDTFKNNQEESLKIVLDAIKKK